MAAAVALQCLDLLFQFVHLRRHLLQLLHQRLDFLRADGQLLDERDGLAAADTQGAAELALVALVGARIEDAGEVFLILLHQVFERLQIVRHALKDLVLFQVLRQRHLDGAIEGQFAGVNALEGIDDLAQRSVAFEDFAAEALAGDFDLLGQGDFLLALEQGDLAHLRQVHAHRIVDAPAVILVEEADVEFGADLVVEHGAAALALLGLRLVDQLDTLIFQQDEELIDLFGVGVVIG